MYLKSYKVIELYDRCKAVYAFVYYQLGKGKLPQPLYLNISFKRLLHTKKYLAYINISGHLRGL